VRKSWFSFSCATRTRGHSTSVTGRGKDGRCWSRPPPATDPLWEACFEAAVEASHPRNNDSSCAVAEGTSWKAAAVIVSSGLFAGVLMSTAVGVSWRRSDITELREVRIRADC
jgi:hypothetical protein